MNQSPIPPAPAGSRELRLRVISAAVIAPIALGLTWIGGYGFLALVVHCAVVMASEWATIVVGRSTAPLRLALLALVGAGVAAVGIGTRVATAPGLVTGGVIAVLGIAAALAQREAREARDARADPVAVKWAPWGAFYAGIPCVALISLRDAPIGLWLVLFLFAVVWSTDIAAYFTGRAIGGPKLWPAVSPKKTWSGAIGGLLAAGVAGAVVAHLAGAPRLAPVIGVGAVLSVAAQAGDFFESALKRRFGVKDSGRLIPGHGGLLDRVDGLVAAAVVALLIAVLRGGAGNPQGGLLFW
ncbi:phosphatidate cytidylyltransferase [Siculibacillus lacustris]|uniref:Phosphatidate cytidylyltransferase n=1 Tax=Siculibacillus lacustris TaxID=1549641 RepID=A0A4Q9VRI1_9HYPH|nr:phosphatidate cytidylyltransferase [Siculibacillus lacustris]TBW38484.1 phosphatidate cytidylyltransferase [Siculibacillus lacustris]